MPVLSYTEVVESFNSFRGQLQCERTYCCALSKRTFCAQVTSSKIEDISARTMSIGKYAQSRHTLGELFRLDPDYVILILDRSSTWKDVEYHFFLHLCFLLWRHVAPELF